MSILRCSLVAGPVAALALITTVLTILEPLADILRDSIDRCLLYHARPQLHVFVYICKRGVRSHVHVRLHPCVRHCARVRINACTSFFCFRILFRISLHGIANRLLIGIPVSLVLTFCLLLVVVTTPPLARGSLPVVVFTASVSAALVVTVLALALALATVALALTLTFALALALATIAFAMAAPRARC